MKRTTTGRLRELEVLFLRCRHGWRDFFFELEQGDASLLAEDPWGDLDDFLAEVDPEHFESFGKTLAEMVAGDDVKAQAQALAIIGACDHPFDLAVAVGNEQAIRKDLEAHLALLLAIGQRRFEAGRPAVDAALADPQRRHAALIALAQLDPPAAVKPGRDAYQKDRARIVQTLGRPLDEHEYATFYQMAEGLLQARGAADLGDFLRTVAGSDEALRDELEKLRDRLVKQAEAAAA